MLLRLCIWINEVRAQNDTKVYLGNQWIQESLANLHLNSFTLTVYVICTYIQWLTLHLNISTDIYLCISCMKITMAKFNNNHWMISRLLFTRISGLFSNHSNKWNAMQLLAGIISSISILSLSQPWFSTSRRLITWKCPTKRRECWRIGQ